MENQFERTEMLLGKDAVSLLHEKHVAVFGVGGVGGYVVEALARGGVGAIDLIDNDTVCITNLNRQIVALHSTIGAYKVDVAAERVHDIFPECKVKTFRQFYLPENADEIDLSVYDYVVDCIDTVTAKLELIRRCHRLNVPIISCMGAANKLNPTAFRVTDISKTKMDPLAKVIRRKLRSEGINHLKVVYSTEEPLKPKPQDGENETSQPENGRRVPASNSFVPAAAGLVAGAAVVIELIGLKFGE